MCNVPIFFLAAFTFLSIFVFQNFDYCAYTHLSEGLLSSLNVQICQFFTNIYTSCQSLLSLLGICLYTFYYSEVIVIFLS